MDSIATAPFDTDSEGATQEADASDQNVGGANDNPQEGETETTATPTETSTQQPSTPATAFPTAISSSSPSVATQTQTNLPTAAAITSEPSYGALYCPS